MQKNPWYFGLNSDKAPTPREDDILGRSPIDSTDPQGQTTLMQDAITRGIVWSTDP